MAPKANITSVDALREFRADLIVYLTKARPALAEVTSDVTRMRQWVVVNQRLHWENQLRRRRKKLEEAQAALLSARIADLRDVTSAEQMALRKAREAVDEAEAKLRVVRQWSRDFDNRMEPLVKQLDKLDAVLAHDLPKGIAFLTEAAKTLDDYAGIAAPASAPDSATRPDAGAPGGNPPELPAEDAALKP